MIHECSVLHTPQQNGLAEQFNRTILESAKSMLHAADLPLGFWGETIKTAVHIRNCFSVRTINWKTPHELITGRLPDISYVCIFKCKAYVHNLK
jgi:hypothetical protein